MPNVQTIKKMQVKQSRAFIAMWEWESRTAALLLWQDKKAQGHEEHFAAGLIKSKAQDDFQKLAETFVSSCSICSFYQG